MRSGITIGKLSAETGVNIETIRYYEKIGLMQKPGRTNGGHRIYTPVDMTRLRFVRRGRELGFSLDDVRSLLGLEDEQPSCAAVHAITVRHLDTIRAKIRDLKKLEKQLAKIAKECGKGDVFECPVIDALSAQ